EGIPPAARALAEQGERLALSLVEVEPGLERAVAAALGPRASALVAGDAAAALKLLEQAAAAGLGQLRVLAGRDPDELVAELPVVERERLLASPVPAVTREGYGYDPQRGELWFAGETAEAVLLELDARRRALAEETRLLAEQARAAERAVGAAEEAAEAAEAAFAAVPPRLRVRRAGVGVLRSLVAAARRLERCLAGLDRSIDPVEAPLRTRGESGAERAAELGATLRALGERETALRRELAGAAERAAAA